MVEASLSWSPLQWDDLPELAELRAAIEYLDDPVDRQSLSDLEEYFETPDAEATENAVVGRDKGGTIVAYAWNHPEGEPVHDHIWIDGGVHPGWRHRHIGRHLLAWSIARAKEWHEELRELSNLPVPALTVVGYADEKLHAPARLFEQAGMRPEAWYFDMHRSFATHPAPEELPVVEGYSLRPFTLEASEATRVSHNAVFANRVGSRPVSRAAWDASLQRPTARPEWSWVVQDGDAVVAYAMNSYDSPPDSDDGSGEGWTDRLGVLAAHRSAGLGLALLEASVHSFARAGLTGAGLGVDTEDAERALALFTRAGYEHEEMVVRYGLTFPAGVRDA
ncbi:MAG TPA: GNAT family N-acetyltransferase [Propionibacteriaceae bacterium]|nr:GNAT family N-acetyltransferase [Propionibacteriaceae bacterium]